MVLDPNPTPLFAEVLSLRDSMIVIRISQLAEQLGVHRNTVRNWIKSGKLPTRSAAGKRYLVSESDFAKLCQEYGLDRSSLKLKHIPGGRALEKEIPLSDETLRRPGARSHRLRPGPQWADLCLTCGSCSSGCALSGVDDLDPRKAIRMVLLGLEEDLIDSQWPWKCTLCGKCEEACPMNIEIVDLIRRVRMLRDRDRIPGSLHKGAVMCAEKGNNLGIPQEDFVALVEELAREMAQEDCPGFSSPLDIKGANLLVLVNSKLPFSEPDDMKLWWKIFYAAGESWTIPSRNWEGINWGLFTGDDDLMKTMVGKIVENMYRLECRSLLLPE